VVTLQAPGSGRARLISSRTLPRHGTLLLRYTLATGLYPQQGRVLACYGVRGGERVWQQHANYGQAVGLPAGC
jgi:hypothetical protein